MSKNSVILAVAFFLSAGVNAAEKGVSFSQLDEHERAAIVHESVNNGQAYAHQQMAEKHRQQMAENP